MAGENETRKPEGAQPAAEEKPKLNRRDFLKAGYSRAVASLLVGGAAVSGLTGCFFYDDYYDYYDYYSNYYGNSYYNYYSDYYVYYSNYYNYSA